MTAKIGKHPVKVIAYLDGVVQSERIYNLTVYQQKDGSLYSNHAGRSTVTLDGDQYTIRRYAKKLPKENSNDIVDRILAKEGLERVPKQTFGTTDLPDGLHKDENNKTIVAKDGKIIGKQG